ncbi:MAG: DUF3237 family protein [Lachnospiraceae bacterium]|nr:DUF3237 family protein [Lachnospiraceae bacterium]
MEKGDELFTVHINCYADYEVNCEGTLYKQILFDGNVTGACFNGRILPGGVDTQIINPDGKGSLCARYILEGKDSLGNDCRIFVENTAEIGSQLTFPKCCSDSSELSWLKDAELRGYMIFDEEDFRIVIKKA